MPLHPWWAAFGTELSQASELTPVLAQELASLAGRGALPGVALGGVRQSSEPAYAAVHLEIEVERPQDLAHPIRGVEPVAIFFPFDETQPSILALRDDFPDTPHQNYSGPEMPRALCIDDRPWAEARLSATGADIARRIQLWLAKAARGDLHDPTQPPDPLFFKSPLSLVFPSSVRSLSGEPLELEPYLRCDNPELIMTRPLSSGGGNQLGFAVLVFRAGRNEDGPLREAPKSLANLASELETRGIQLVDALKVQLRAWLGSGARGNQRLLSRLAIVVAFSTGRDAAESRTEVRAFLISGKAGDIGVALGLFHPNSCDGRDNSPYVLAVPEGPQGDLSLSVEPAHVYVALDRAAAADIAGRPNADNRRVVLVGAGSLGSQVALNLAREGQFSWTIIDDDHLLPHNLVRHALFANDTGAPKAVALAEKIQELQAVQTGSIRCDVLDPREVRETLENALDEADLIVDAAASVAVSRHLADHTRSRARRVCTFFNPAGNAVAVLAEDADRKITLRDLEAQYHRLVLTDPKLTKHLAVEASGVRYSGSCRSLTNQISTTNASILSAIAARGISGLVEEPDATIAIWTLEPDGEVRLVRRKGSAVIRRSLGGWTVSYDEDLAEVIAALRASKLPKETGGVLLGIVDRSRRSIHLAHAMPPTVDSEGSEVDFERGVAGLADEIQQAVAATMHQLRYVGEWHSHPDRASAMPSSVDLAQLLWLRREMEYEGLPALMVIASEGRGITLMLGSGDENARERKA